MKIAKLRDEPRRKNAGRPAPSQCRTCSEKRAHMFDWQKGGARRYRTCKACRVKMLERQKTQKNAAYAAYISGTKTSRSKEKNRDAAWRLDSCLYKAWVPLRPILMAHRYLIIYLDQVEGILE